jgi:serine/arginine repetitive matrix protein 1
MRGTTYEQDPRYKDKESKLMATKDWPLEYSITIDPSKVNLKAVRAWVSRQTSSILGVEDEILDTLIMTALEEPVPCPKRLQIMIEGFLESKTEAFVLKLWRLLLNAQTNPLGIPQQFINERREDLLKRKRELERLCEELKERSKPRKHRSRSRSDS